MAKWIAVKKKEYDDLRDAAAEYFNLRENRVVHRDLLERTKRIEASEQSYNALLSERTSLLLELEALRAALKDTE